MKTRFPAVFGSLLLFGLLLLLSGCGMDQFMQGISRGDWVYRELPNQYAVARINGRTILLGKELRQSGEAGTAIDTVIDAYVSYIAQSGDWILVQQVEVPEHSREPVDLSDPVYYIVDSRTDEKSGPYTEAEFRDESALLGLTVQWIRTTELPQLSQDTQ